ncbi:hypothetical protein AB6A40_002849 [Gnathostoma spinigerum]|uniref:INO80 complex subunit E N-terminal domain-containing protein n=1 Tax=Gnathostoma spinigerum TaxID=75299 RepID=A0ABD6EIL2_9BILA
MGDQVNDSNLSMRLGASNSQPLPSVSHVMAPPSHFSSSSYVSPQPSQPSTPMSSTGVTPSPLSAAPRAALPQHIQTPMSMAGAQSSAQQTYNRIVPPAQAHNEMQVGHSQASGSFMMHQVPNSNLNVTMLDSGRINSNANGQPNPTPKEQYRLLKKRFKFLVYENECYQEELRNLQRKLLKLSRDKNFLLDRLIQYEKLSDSSDDSDTNSVKTVEEKPKSVKKKSRPAPRRRPTISKQRTGVAIASRPEASSVSSLGSSEGSKIETSENVKMEDICCINENRDNRQHHSQTPLGQVRGVGAVTGVKMEDREYKTERVE